MSVAKKFFDKDGKETCFGCEACLQSCPKDAIRMEEDQEGFRYPVADNGKCIECGICEKVCPYDNPPAKNTDEKYVFGGYHLNPLIRFESTSGGAFSAIVDAFCDENYAIFGAKADGLNVYHTYITDKTELSAFRKSKYSQSVIGDSYKQVKQFLKEGKKVLFSGTPCQIAGLKTYLGKSNQDNLLTVEVICEGVPSPLYVRKLEQKLKAKYGSKIKSYDYRYTGKALFQRGKWDFQQTNIQIEDGSSGGYFSPFSENGILSKLKSLLKI